MLLPADGSNVMTSVILYHRKTWRGWACCYAKVLSVLRANDDAIPNVLAGDDELKFGEDL